VIEELVKDMLATVAILKANQAGFNFRLRMEEDEVAAFQIDLTTLADDIDKIEDGSGDAGA